MNTKSIIVIVTIVVIAMFAIPFSTIVIPWDFYFECLQNGMVPSGTRENHSCHEIIGQKHQYRFWQENLDFGNGIYYLRVLFSYSDDYGLTFSKPQDISMTDLNSHEPKMIVMDNDVILVWRDEVADEPDLSFAKSTDFGKTLEKKRLFYGARPDIVYYDQTLYLTYVDLYPPSPQIWYSKSDDRGETFSEPKLIFEVDWELSPYADRPTPTLEVNANNVIISWRMQNENGQYAIWKAVDAGKHDNFEVTNFIENT